MWIDKLVRGVLELDTPIGPRYLQPSFIQRARLLWTFRNFSSLTQQVLLPSEARLIDRLSDENRFVSSAAIAADDCPIIGRIERRGLAPMQSLPTPKPASSAISDRSREAAA